MQRQDSATDVRDISLGKIEAQTPIQDGVDLTVLGVCTGTGLLHLDCALVRFGQQTPSAPLRVKLQQVSARYTHPFPPTHLELSSIQYLFSHR